MTKYEQMLARARKDYSTRKAAMVRGGMTSAEAKATMKAETDRRFAIASARSKCGFTKHSTTRLADKWPKC